jgi:hypothetical protein
MSSLTQGVEFAKLTAAFHGGATRKGSRRAGRKGSRRAGRKGSRRAGRKGSRRAMAGGAMPELPTLDAAFAPTISDDMHAAAGVAALNKSFAELSQFHQTGGARTQRGGMSPVTDSAMILTTAAEEKGAQLNPQWYTENMITPGFKGPDTVYGNAKGGARARKTRKVRTIRRVRKTARHVHEIKKVIKVLHIRRPKASKGTKTLKNRKSVAKLTNKK